MDILLSVMNLLTHNHIMRIVFLIFVRAVPIQPAEFSICTCQHAHLTQPKLTVIGQRNWDAVGTVASILIGLVVLAFVAMFRHAMSLIKNI